MTEIATGKYYFECAIASNKVKTKNSGISPETSPVYPTSKSMLARHYRDVQQI